MRVIDPDCKVGEVLIDDGGRGDRLGCCDQPDGVRWCWVSPHERNVFGRIKVGSGCVFDYHLEYIQEG